MCIILNDLNQRKKTGNNFQMDQYKLSIEQYVKKEIKRESEIRHVWTLTFSILTLGVRKSISVPIKNLNSPKWYQGSIFSGRFHLYFYWLVHRQFRLVLIYAPTPAGRKGYHSCIKTCPLSKKQCKVTERITGLRKYDVVPSNLLRSFNKVKCMNYQVTKNTLKSPKIKICM